MAVNEKVESPKVFFLKKKLHFSMQTLDSRLSKQGRDCSPILTLPPVPPSLFSLNKATQLTSDEASPKLSIFVSFAGLNIVKALRKHRLFCLEICKVLIYGKILRLEV